MVTLTHDFRLLARTLTFSYVKRTVSKYLIWTPLLWCWEPHKKTFASTVVAKSEGDDITVFQKKERLMQVVDDDHGWGCLQVDEAKKHTTTAPPTIQQQAQKREEKKMLCKLVADSPSEFGCGWSSKRHYVANCTNGTPKPKWPHQGMRESGANFV